MIGWDPGDLSCTAPAMAARSESCAQCGKQGVGFKRCSFCKIASYCGAECQNANWKRHKRKCARPLSLGEVIDEVNALAEGDWRGVLKWEGRMDDMMANKSDVGCEFVLQRFCLAHIEGLDETLSNDHRRSIIRLETRRIPLLGKLQRFRDQGEVMCQISSMLFILERDADAAMWMERARDVGAAHGFFSVESRACRGLGMLAIEEGRREEGVALLRNSLVAAELNELDAPEYELDALDSLIKALFRTGADAEAEPLVLRYHEAAKAQSARGGGIGKVCSSELRSLVYAAALHEVLCVCILRRASLYP